MNYSGSHQTRGSPCKSSLLCLNWNRISKFSLSSPKLNHRLPCSLLPTRAVSLYMQKCLLGQGKEGKRKDRLMGWTSVPCDQMLSSAWKYSRSPGTPTLRRWKPWGKTTGYSRVNFLHRKKQGKPTSWAHLHLNWGKNPKCFVQLKMNQYRPFDFSCFFQSASHLSVRDQLLPKVPSDLQSNECRSSFP